MSGRRSTKDILEYTYFLGKFTGTVADGYAATFLLPNPFYSQQLNQVAEIFGAQVLWDTPPFWLTGSDLTATGQHGMSCIVEMDTQVIAKNNTTAANNTASNTLAQGFLSSPTELIIKQRILDLAVFASAGGTTAPTTFEQGTLMWFQDDWFMSAGMPNDPTDAVYLATPNFLVHFYFYVPTNLVVPSGLATSGQVNPTFKLYCRPKKLTIQKVLEIQSSQTRQLVTTAS